MQVFVEPDASTRIVYDISFANNPSAQAIDIVDIGTPHGDYDIANMSASINEVPLSDIRVSEVIDTGVEVHLHNQAIPPGGTGTLHFEFTMPDMVYQDTTNDELASLQITPTWFDGQSVVGSSDVWVLVHMLPEVQAEEVLYQDVPFTDKVIFEEHPVAVWRWENGTATGPNPVGVSFPQRGMTRVVKQNLLDLTLKWLEDNPGVRFMLGAISFVLVGFAFFRFSGGTGLSLFVIIAAGLALLLINSPGAILLALPGAIALVGLGEWGRTRRKQRYLPAIAQVEGGGIKRGLTAPEAAVILELPLNKVLLLIFFGLLEKGVLKQLSDTPLAVEVNLEFRTGDIKGEDARSSRLEVAQRLGIVLRAYEHDFLDLIESNAGRPVEKIDFSGPMKSLLEHTAGRLKGFDLSDTQDYYRKIIQRALKEANNIGDIPERERYLDRHLQWLLLDPAYPTIFTARGYHYRPIWVRPFASSDRLGTPGVPSTPSAAGPSVPGGKTSFGDVAASFAGWTENTMGDLASSIAPGSLQVEGAGGIVNLGGVDKVTGDIFKALASSSGSSGWKRLCLRLCRLRLCLCLCRRRPVIHRCLALLGCRNAAGALRKCQAPLPPCRPLNCSAGKPNGSPRPGPGC
jgi:hypothetical protein